MTCASCATRIEKKLNRLDGVTASVNYATEKAVVSAPAALDPQVLIDEVEKTGYTRGSSPPPASAPARARGPRADGAAPAPHRLCRAVGAGDPLAMIPALQFTYWQWVSLALAAPVVVWGAWPFHRAAWVNLRHGAATMDTLDLDRRLGGVPVVALRAVLRARRHARHDARVRVDRAAQRRRRRTSTSRSPPASRCSCSPAATSSCARSGARAPRCARCSSSARRTSPCSGDGRRGPRPDRRSAGRRRVRGAPGREDRDRRRRRVGHVRGRRVAGHRRVGARRGRPGRRGGRRDRQRRRPPRRARRRAWATTPSSRRWRGWSRRRSRARRTCSASPTASRACSCRSSSRSRS